MIPRYLLFSVMTQLRSTLHKDLAYMRKYELSNGKYYLT